MLYPQLLNADFERLPRVLRDFHSTPGGGRASGTVEVRHERRWLARLTGFPPSGERVPLAVEVAADGNCEVWTRRFGSGVRRSVQRQQDGLLLETAGPLRLLFRVFADPTGLRFESQRVRLWILPIPLRVTAEARGRQSSWDLHVTIAGVGSYHGIMAPTV